MRPLILIATTLLLCTGISAQTADSYGNLRAKVQHVKEKYTGQPTAANHAIVLVLHKLCNDYNGRLSLQQYKELHSDIEAMRLHSSDTTIRRQLDEASLLLRQKSDTLDIQQRILDYYAHAPQEQIYLHTDKPYYVPGDTVWFRAHLVDAVTHTPISRSRYVYVELLDNAADTLCQRIIVRCDSDGVFANALTLPRHLQGGSYTLVAYTQWMRNFSAERFCYHPLWVAGSEPRAEYESARLGLPVRPARTASPLGSDSPLQVGQRKGHILVRLDHHTTEPLACALYGNGNLLVTDYTPGKVLRIDSQSLRPGSLSVAIVNRQTGDIIAESQTRIEAPQPQVSIRGDARQHNEPMELTIDVAEADGTPLYGNFSVSITDYDVVKPDSVLPTIGECLAQQPDGYMLADMLSGKYPRIDYGFQTSQTISGQIRGTIFKRIKRPKLMLVRPDTGFRTTFELGDSSRFTIRGLDFPDGTTYVLEGTRQTGSTSLVQLDIDPQTFPTLHSPLTPHLSPLSIPDGFARQAQEQVMYGSVDRVVDLPEVVKEKKRRHKPTNLLGVTPFRAFYDDDPVLNNFHSMEILLTTLGIPVYRDANGELRVSARHGSLSTPASRGPVIFIDEFRSNVEELLMLQPETIESIEWFNHIGAAHMTIYGWNVSTSGLLLVRQKPGLKGRTFRPLSMATVRQQGWKPNVEFFSPQYPDPAQKTRPDHRTTLYWNPKVKTDEKGRATVRFYASDISRRYLVTLEGVSDDGMIIHKQAVIE
ncbi:MAG: hypothetical protein J6O23_03455 [Prevotella sp.]|nr:hypothetical protein [Prevotella sp.]